MAHDFPPLKNDLLLRAARGEVVERPPCWIMRQAGRYLPEYHEAKGTNDFFACCRSPEIASTLTLQPIDRFDGLLDAAIIFSDILVIPQALGMTVEMVDKKGPHFPSPLTGPEDPQYASVMAVDLPTAAAELDYVYKAITMTRHKLAGRVPLIGFCGAPWTLLCYMVEGGGTKLFIQSKKWVYRHADAARALLQKIADLCVEYLALQVQAGAQAVMVFDSWAGELGPREFASFSEPYLAHIAAHLPAKLRSLGLDPVPMTVFPKGAWHALGRACDLGYDAVGIDWMQDPAEAVRIRGDRRVALQGNADPGVLYGTKEEMTRAAQVMVDGFWKEKKGWICNLGHGITPGVNPDDLKFFLSEVHRLTQQ
ncbi:uroporphyrinogen decarboxylase [Verticillium alfalfae VaMs.102]|uniref:Uroporphyrinogen decarboxylase n=1 Tax=Verticillium alfalfae (strain VaMs.102 / ATCC MYA-4576 / FGSC 10136) TaxID=526221 RepID=C9SHG2_VERA1|nr:uroporphyrinogen decarboxylase [Verticillium alfalfae VaMs.102]EEY18385.1 uroporphyrinogen decarboxylase [Verticillium alfalfae VaMs.102]